MAMVNRTTIVVIGTFMTIALLTGCGSSMPKKQTKAPVITATPKNAPTINPTISTQPTIVKKQTKPQHELRNNIVAQAKAQIGKPYRLGGTSPNEGFDCSGLVHYTHQHIGLDLPRRSEDQYHASQKSKTVEPGDLMFFSISSRGKRIDHVGIYIGNNQFVHAPGKGKPVRIADISNDYWKRKFIGTGTYLK